MDGPKIQLPSMRALLAFWAAATHDRMAEAAEALGVTESAVSHQIRQLEASLHAQLFDRASGRLALTETGRRYLARIEPALREIQAATEAIGPDRGRSTVRVTLPPSIAVTWLIPRLGAFETAHPEVDLQLLPTTRIVDMSRDRIDAAIRYGRGDWPGVDATFLFDDLATPVAAPGFLPEDAAPTNALLAKTRLLVNRGVPDEWREWARARGLDPPSMSGAVALDAIEQVLQAAETGSGLAMGRSPYIEARLANGSLVAPFGGVGPTGAAYFLCRPKGAAPTAATRRFIRWLSAEATSFQDGRAAPAADAT